MNLLLLEPREVTGDRARVGGARARHLREVLHAEPGRALRVGVIDGPHGEGDVIAADGDEVELSLRLDRPAPAPSGVDVVLAVPRPKTLAKLLPDLSALGVDRLFLIRTWKVEKPYLDSPLLQPGGYRPLLVQGAMQARSTRLPEVHVEPLFRPWIEDRAPGLFADCPTRWVMDPSAPASSADAAVAGPPARAALAIGPEAGLVDFELERFAAAGFTAVSLGDRPLRVEVATVAAWAQLALRRALARPSPHA